MPEGMPFVLNDDGSYEWTLRTRVTSQLSAALRAAAAGIHPDEAAAGLIISHGTFLHRDD